MGRSRGRGRGRSRGRGRGRIEVGAEEDVVAKSRFAAKEVF